MMCLKFGKSNNLSRTTSEERKKNDEIDRMIRKDKKAQAKNVKILLLGGELHPASVDEADHNQGPESLANPPFSSRCV